MDFLTSIFGILSSEFLMEGVVGLVVLVCVLGFFGAPLWLWTGVAGMALWGYGAANWTWWIFAALALIFNVPPIRRVLLSTGIMKILQALHILPVISETEQTAIEAGTVWVEGELFSGNPDF